MAYEKQTWNCDDVITADKLNHMEDGIESASSGGGTSEPLIVKASNGKTGVLDHTWNEIANAPVAWFEYQESGLTYRIAITELRESLLGYMVVLAMSTGELPSTVFITPDADGYPEYNDEDDR